MSATFAKESDNLFTVRIEGIFTFEDLQGLQKKGRAEIDLGQKVKMLILAEQFNGWGKEGDWGDLTFMYEFDPSCEKIAVVSKEKWKDDLLMFLGAGMRQAKVEFFLDGAEEDARKWLQSESRG